MSGTVNISRDIFHDEAFKPQPFTEREAFIWLIMEASFVDRKKRVSNTIISLRRGQLAASVRFMAAAWGWQKSTVDRFLKRLENRDMIGTVSGTGLNVVTIRKYNEYQTSIKESGTPKVGTAGQQRDSSGTNYNNDATTIDKNPPTPQAGFEAFWKSWPSKVSAKTARRAWGRLTDAEQATATATAEAWFLAWRRLHPDAAPISANRFLTDRRWDDDGFQAVASAPVDTRQFQADAIRSGKEYLTRSISAARARELVTEGFITMEECKRAGIA